MSDGPMVVLFGAGASFGGGDTSPKSPPLGKDLFEVLQRLYPPTWGQIPSELAGTFRANFEEGMGVVIEKHGFAIGPLMQDVAKFFSIFSVGSGTNLYVRFIRKAREQGYLGNLLLSTLNYECILETALSLAGLSISYFGELPNDSGTAGVWKLHGSCNFRLKELQASRGIRYSGTGISFGGGIDPLQPAEVQSYYSGNTALYPAMALFATGKPISIAPAPIKDAQAKWGELVKRASLVAVIGVNPNPDDSHLWTPLAETDAELVYIGGPDNFQAWKGQYRESKNSKMLGSGWDQGFDALISELSEVWG